MSKNSIYIYIYKSETGWLGVFVCVLLVINKVVINKPLFYS
jgi:hypothetical protein